MVAEKEEPFARINEVNKVYEKLIEFTETSSREAFLLTDWLSSFKNTQARVEVRQSNGESVFVESVRLRILETMLEEFGPRGLLTIIIASNDNAYPHHPNGYLHKATFFYRFYSFFVESCGDPKTGAYSEELADEFTKIPVEWQIQMAME